MSRKLDILQASVGIEFYSEMNLIAAGRIIAVHSHRSISQIAKISRPTRMIENHFLVKLFDFGAHEKKRTAAWSISIIRSISSVVL